MLLCSFVHGNSSIDELKNEVVRDLYTIPGWCSKEKALNFIDLVLEVRPQVCVEIGVYGGRSIFPVAKALKFLGQGIAIGIDSWDRIDCMKYLDTVVEDPLHADAWGRTDLDSIYRSYLDMISRHNLEKYCETRKLSSEKAASTIDVIDILYIDGNHSEIISVQDVRLYLPKVRYGGYIWLNDSKWRSLGAAYYLLSQSCDVVLLIDNENCVLFRKK